MLLILGLTYSAERSGKLQQQILFRVYDQPDLHVFGQQQETRVILHMKLHRPPETSFLSHQKTVKMCQFLKMFMSASETQLHQNLHTGSPCPATQQVGGALYEKLL